MSATLAGRLRDESDLCNNEGATDIAKLLDEAANALEAAEASLKYEREVVQGIHKSRNEAIERAEAAEQSLASAEAATVEIEFSTCTLCAAVPSDGFYTGCMIKDGQCKTDWQCDGNGHLARVRALQPGKE